jgi:hypothetical protein
MPVLFHTYVYRPWTDSRDSSKRVSTLDHPVEYKRKMVLNPLYITDLQTHAKGSTFLYSDNFGDRREGPSRIICDHTVAQIKTHMDTSANSNAIKLPIFPNNNPSKTPVDTTISWATIAYADMYNPDKAVCCWVIYDKGSFKRVEVLVKLAIEDVVRLVTSGNTTATFSTYEGPIDLF